MPTESEVIDVERQALAAMLKDKQPADVFDYVAPEDFLDPIHADIAAAIRALAIEGRPSGSADVLHQLDTAGKINDRLNQAYIVGLAKVPAVAAYVDSYAQKVGNFGQRRRLVMAAARIEDIANGYDGEDLRERALKELDGIESNQSRLRWIADILPDVIAGLDRSNGQTTFAPTPWPKLNAGIGGFRPGAVYVVAARPGEGKSVVAGQCALELAKHGTVAFSSLEMSDIELLSRMISAQLQIPQESLKNARMSDHDWHLLNQGREQVSALQIAIDDRASVTVDDIRAHARQVARKAPLAGIVVDYMQLAAERQGKNRYEQVTNISRSLKVMAKDLHVPVIALAQLNRQAEERGYPIKSDLRDSGAIEQDADVIMLLHREEIPNPYATPDERLIIDIAKNRHGELGTVTLDWQGAFSRALHMDQG